MIIISVELGDRLDAAPAPRTSPCRTSRHRVHHHNLRMSGPPPGRDGTGLTGPRKSQNRWC